MKTRSMYFYMSLALALTAPVFAHAEEPDVFNDPIPTQAPTQNPADPAKPAQPAQANNGKGFQPYSVVGSGGLFQRNDNVDGNSWGISFLGGYYWAPFAGVEGSVVLGEDDYVSVHGKVMRLGGFLNNCTVGNADESNFCVHAGVSGRGRFGVGTVSGDGSAVAQFTLMGRKKFNNGLEIGVGGGTQAGIWGSNRIREGTPDNPVEFADGKRVPGTGAGIFMGGYGAQGLAYADYENATILVDGGWLHNFDSAGITRNVGQISGNACAKKRSKLTNAEKAKGMKESKTFLAACAGVDVTIVGQENINKITGGSPFIDPSRTQNDIVPTISFQGNFQ